MDKETAKQIADRIESASSKCEASLRTVMANESLGHAKVLGRLVGDFMGYSFTNILAPIWKQFPDLEPPEMREPYVEPEPALSEDSQNALRDFLAEAKAAVAMVKSQVSEQVAEDTFAFGKLPELESAVSAIEQFLKVPRIRDLENQ